MTRAPAGTAMSSEDSILAPQFIDLLEALFGFALCWQKLYRHIFVCDPRVRRHPADPIWDVRPAKPVQNFFEKFAELAEFQERQ